MIGSRMMFIATEPSIIMAGVFVSPVALMTLLLTIGKTTKISPMYHMRMYCFTRGAVSSVAPIIPKTLSIVRSPATMNIATKNIDRARPSVVSLFTSFQSPFPMARETTEAAPTLRPSANLDSTSSTGKVKLIAASSRIPRRLTKKVSVRLNANMPTMPTAIGTVSEKSFFPIGPSVRTARFVIFRIRHFCTLLFCCRRRLRISGTGIRAAR